MALDDALEKAWADFKREDLAVMAQRAGVPPPDKDGQLWVTLAGRHFAVVPEEEQVLEGGRTPARDDMAVLVLHYLAGAKATDLTGSLISFRELRGGDVYYSAFERRSIIRLIEAFGRDPERFKAAAKSMAGTRAPVGEIGMVIRALPKVPVTVAIWTGDDEVPASANILFDESIKWHMHTEDVAVLSGLLASELIKRASRD